MLVHLSFDIICSSRITGFSSSFALGKLFASWNRQCPRTNIRAYFGAQWKRLFIYPYTYFYSIVSGSYKTAPRSFLFSLVNPSGLSPTMMSLRAEYQSYAIYCHTNYGPTFGGNHDLHVANAPNAGNCSTNLNHSYQCPKGQNAQTFLTGGGNFSVSEMEVFGVKEEE